MTKNLACGFRFLSAFLLMCVNVSLVHAEAVQLTIGQFVHQAWSAKDGAPGNVHALAQTTDGFLWLGTGQGLYRFDGVSFERYEPFKFSNISALLVARNGDLWIAFGDKGVSRLRGGRTTDYSESDGLPSKGVWSLTQDLEGAIWAGTEGGLFRFEHDHWQPVGADWGVPPGKAQATYVDRNGTLWVASERNIIFLPPGSKKFEATGVNIGQTFQFAESPGGTLWMAETTRSVHPLVLAPDQQSAEPEIKVGSAGILFDADGSLWITSIGDGMRRVPFPDRLNGQKIGEFSDAVESFTAKEGLTSDYLTCILKDREGNIWVGSSVGLDQFRRGALVPILLPAKFTRKALIAGDDGKILVGSYSPGLAEIEGNTWKNVEPGSAILSGFRDPHGAIWLLDTAGKSATSTSDLPTYHVWRLEKGKLDVVAEMPDVSHNYLAALAQDRMGNLWIGNEADLFFLENGRWVRFETPSEVAGKEALVAFTDIDGRVWFGFTDNTILVVDGTNARTFSSKEGVQVGSVTAITGKDRHIWIGGKGGLEAWQGDRFRPVVPVDSDAFHGVTGVQEDADGDLLLSEQRGVALISASEISKFLKDPSARVEYRIFDVRDGLPGTIQQSSPYPISVKGTDGRIWFSTSSGVAWIDPAHIPKNVLAPPIVIRSMTANGVRYPLLSDLKLPARTQDLTIDYTALSLAIPERVRFRYKLEGSDTQWQDAGGRRQAFYNNLSAGSYRFEVLAANDDGVWNEQPASVSFKIQPAFYETVWFRLGCILAGLLILASVYRWRLQRILQRVDTLHNERIAERERIARDLHDTLLQSVQGIILRFHATLLRMRENDPLRAEIEDTLQGANRVLQEGRDKVSGLRGTWDTNPDIEAALAELGRELAQQSASTIRITTEGESRQLTPMTCDEVYRIGAEALLNAVRHAGADEVEVEISWLARELRLRVRDNGRGIPADVLNAGARSGHWGLPGMRERATRLGAKLTISSNPDAGTEIELRVPAFVAYGWRKDSGLRRVLADLRKPK